MIGVLPKRRVTLLPSTVFPKRREILPLIVSPERTEFLPLIVLSAERRDFLSKQPKRRGMGRRTWPKRSAIVLKNSSL